MNKPTQIIEAKAVEVKDDEPNPTLWQMITKGYSRGEIVVGLIVVAMLGYATYLAVSQHIARVSGG